ncbi:hypothetical protein EIP91_004042 [Steccherinum ochraceum]|uniref:Uncharacterized protein n=1 Tax=Steccherinum ochraceum TaxID=92696 RepID=A0A4R0R9I8_9APHY|nr:hypothetical protein EIP91_004042 [Steccherinum ochraceum]
MSSATQARHFLQNSLDMVAARSTLLVDLTQPSGTDNAWSMLDSPMLDSPTLGRMSSFIKGKAPVRDKPVPAPLSLTPVNVAPLTIRKANVAPLDIKKIRRRGFMTGVQLDLPPTPQPPQRSPLAISTTMPLSPPPSTALTFTAEWDLTQRAFVFTPFETSYPLSATSPYPTVSPVPDDVASVSDTVALAEDEVVPVEITPPSPSSSVSTPYSELFDDASVYSQDDDVMRELESSAPSSASAPSMSPHGLYTKPEASSSSSLSRLVTLHLFEEELHRAIPADSNDSDFDKECYEEMEEDLILAPNDVFERMLWESTKSDARLSQLYLNTNTPRDIYPNFSRQTVPLLPLGPGSAVAELHSPESPYSSYSPPSAVTVARHSRNLSFPSPGARLRPKGPRRRRNLSAML